MVKAVSQLNVSHKTVWQYDQIFFLKALDNEELQMYTDDGA